MEPFNIIDITNIRSPYDFNEKAIEIFHFQRENNEVYKKYVGLLNLSLDSIEHYSQIPFMPILFFKTHKILCGNKYDQVFTSSGTGGKVSQHFVKDSNIYQCSWQSAFEEMIGRAEDLCVLCLLPSYLERKGSSLIDMCQGLIELSKDERSGFYLYNHDELFSTLQILQQEGKKTLLLGVSFALLDFCKEYPIQFPDLMVMETGGMKGRKEEMTRDSLHKALKEGFGVGAVWSEYGMTELLSQAYSKGNGVFETPAWMTILIREPSDPKNLLSEGRGAINIVDLANVYSCSFIATDDLGRLYNNGSFEVLGRLDNSQIRGCNLMVV